MFARAHDMGAMTRIQVGLRSRLPWTLAFGRTNDRRRGDSLTSPRSLQELGLPIPSDRWRNPRIKPCNEASLPFSLSNPDQGRIKGVELCRAWGRQGSVMDDTVPASKFALPAGLVAGSEIAIRSTLVLPIPLWAALAAKLYPKGSFESTGFAVLQGFALIAYGIPFHVKAKKCRQSTFGDSKRTAPLAIRSRNLRVRLPTLFASDCTDDIVPEMQ
ncbi:hypothetical protein HD554DRAFT_2291749 [Boletus coccyginus]|nr:hypothetical protein HD554DRAFT_2291749 [Boletus coccyginus]